MLRIGDGRHPGFENALSSCHTLYLQAGVLSVLHLEFFIVGEFCAVFSKKGMIGVPSDYVVNCDMLVVAW